MVACLRRLFGHLNAAELSLMYDLLNVTVTYIISRQQYKCVLPQARSPQVVRYHRLSNAMTGHKYLTGVIIQQ